MLRTSEKNCFKYPEYNHFLIVEFIVVDSNYKMDLELLRSFGGLLSRVVLLLSLSGFTFLMNNQHLYPQGPNKHRDANHCNTQVIRFVCFSKMEL